MSVIVLQPGSLPPTADGNTNASACNLRVAIASGAVSSEDLLRSSLVPMRRRG